ncbi:hypothetical protein BK120_21695 [Paenibacillus sp. FSL A5-0031]|uniref:putative phage abortive infection protein n=1 Tax=Paenibacillus sp. FSL A5-0031 TaxID=1920420 RepID=UPI00096D3B6A|nr:putative phage abortive infection protein [Paenibacillus sp. FSL A5-0031]OME79592.1 hypothetical protein BK120_21695 [Paenibacillus sp. FSL A5-0031]
MKINLGTVGDFFGGTTVGLLSLASIIFVTAAIMMQKEELELQRNEVQKTREEYEITNATMKKQQFDSTFFNMINLHHDITKDIVIEGTTGRAAMQIVILKIKAAYKDNDVFDAYIKDLKKEALEGDIKLLDELIRNRYFYYRKEEFKRDSILSFKRSGIREGNEEYEKFFEDLENGINKDWNELKIDHTVIYEKAIYLDYIQYETLLSEIDFLSAHYTSTYSDKFKMDYKTNPLKELKRGAFEKVYDSYESQLGHYFRNLYHIIKLIQNEKFHEREQDSNREKRKYLGIIRAQLSSYELLVIFYNIVYSSKGDKFKQLLINTHFFDDHLNVKEFLWPNDFSELEQMNVQ